MEYKVSYFDLKNKVFFNGYINIIGIYGIFSANLIHAIFQYRALEKTFHYEIVFFKIELLENSSFEYFN